jgi:predicted outer membrane repeat protein
MLGKHLFLAKLAGACAMLALPVICQANTITVYALDDVVAPKTTCTLRWAITAANTKAKVNGCAAGSGTDIIVFNSGLSGTITLGSILPAIINTLTIQGTETSPPAITISGGGKDQLLVVNEGATLNLNYLTLTDGNSAPSFDGNVGGIRNLGTLNVANSTLSDNKSADGVAGGVWNEGTAMTVANSTFSRNSAAQGGAIYNEGPLTVVNSTFAGNSADADTFDGAIGGAIVNDNTLTVVNSTFAGNTAPAGGGAIFNINATLNLKGTILASSTGGDCASVTNSIIDKGYNLADDDSCNFTSGTSAVVTDAELELGSLSNTGGPTDTIPLGDTSVAVGVIPAGPSGSCNYVNDVNPCTNRQISPASGQLLCDQRGDPRPEQASGCDVGAFEFQEITRILDFDTGLIIFPLQFAAGGSFTLGEGAVFNPPTQAVTVTLSSTPPLSSVSPPPPFGPLAVTIPAGSFTLVKGQYQYSGTIGGIKYGASISGPVDGAYEFTFAAFGLDVTGITNPVSVTLQIGPNIGTDDDVAAAIL